MRQFRARKPPPRTGRVSHRRIGPKLLQIDRIFTVLLSNWPAINHKLGRFASVKRFAREITKEIGMSRLPDYG